MTNGDWEKRFDQADIRADHAEQKAAADKYVTEQQALALVGHVDELTGEVKDLRTVLNRRNRTLIFMGTFILAVGLTFILLLSIALDNQDSTLENQQVIREQGQIIEAVTSCTIQDTEQKCQEKQAERSKAEGLARLKAVHCIVRSVEEGDPPTRTEQKCTP